MIDLLFQFGPEMVLVKISGSNILFGLTSYGKTLAPIDGLRLSKAGVEKEHPDLIGNPDWHQEAIERFKEHIRKLSSEKKIAQYVIEDLRSHGYTPLKKQEAGKRPEVIK